MDAELTALLSVMTVLGLNQAVMRTPWLMEHPVSFWGTQLTNAVAGLMVATRGIPGVNGHIVSVAIGLLFWYHGVENLRARAELRRLADNELYETEREIAERYLATRAPEEDQFAEEEEDSEIRAMRAIIAADEDRKS